MPIEVTIMTEADIEGAIDCIQQAFEKDPFKNFMFPDKTKFCKSRNRASLRLRCRWGIKHELFHVARSTSNPSRILGVAMWVPPHSDPHWTQHWCLSLNQLYLNLWYGRGGLCTKRFFKWKSQQSAAQKRICTSTKGYYFGNIAAVMPGKQQSGVGRALAKEVLERADREGVGCYLESSRLVPNVEIYEKFGFRMAREIVVEDGDAGELRLFAMVREPRAVGDPSETGCDKVRSRL